MKDMKKKILELHKKGIKRKEISEKLNVKYSTVTKIVKNDQIKIRRAKNPEKFREKAIQELKPEQTRCYISVFTNNLVYVFNINNLIEKYNTKIYNKEKKRYEREYEPYFQKMPIGQADRIFDKKQYYNWFARQTEKCDKGFK